MPVTTDNGVKISIVMSLADPFNYQAFLLSCAEAGIQPLSIGEYAQKTGLLLVAVRQYPKETPLSAYLKLITNMNDAPLPPPTRIDPDDDKKGCCQSSESELMPGMLTQAISAGLAVGRYVAAGAKNVSRASRHERLKQCKACEMLSGTRCSVCGCFVAIKSWMATEACPLNKWMEV